MTEREDSRKKIMEEVRLQIGQVLDDYIASGNENAFEGIIREAGSIIGGYYKKVESPGQLEGLAFASLAVLVALGSISDMEVEFE